MTAGQMKLVNRKSAVAHPLLPAMGFLNESGCLKRWFPTKIIFIGGHASKCTAVIQGPSWKQSRLSWLSLTGTGKELASSKLCTRSTRTKQLFKIVRIRFALTEQNKTSSFSFTDLVKTTCNLFCTSY